VKGSEKEDMATDMLNGDAGTGSVIPGVGPTVLLVDDEPNLRRILSAVLARDGYNIVIADGGRDAIKKAKQQPRLDLLVTDFLMPDMNGLQVLEAIRKQHPDLRALVISGHGTVRSAVEDNGPGVPAEVQPRLWEPFFTTKARGSGLGLAQVRRVMEAHGGSVRFKEVPGGGACFTLSLPAEEQQQGE